MHLRECLMSYVQVYNNTVGHPYLIVFDTLQAFFTENCKLVRASARSTGVMDWMWTRTPTRAA